MKRCGFPQTSGGLKRSGGLARRSKKQERAYAGTKGVEGRRAFVARILAERPRCEARDLWARLFWSADFSVLEQDDLLKRMRGCQGRSVDVHEKLARSAGGSIVDDANCLALCRACHRFVGDRPLEALALGLRLSRYLGRNPTPAIPEAT